MYVTYLSVRYNRDLWAYRYKLKKIHDTKTSQIETCPIVFDTRLYWWHWSLGERRTLFCTTNDRPLCRHKGTGNSAPLSYLDEHGDKLRHAEYCSFYCKIRFLPVNEKKPHNTLIVVDRFLRLMGDKTIPDPAEPRHPPDAWPLFQWPPERYVLATEVENAIFS